MILIIGGSYQGKLKYARSRFRLAESDIFLCSEETSVPDFSRRCVAYVDRYALGCIDRGEEPADAFRANIDALRDSVVISTDISGGVVPIDPRLRAWREANGRLNNYLAGQASEVWRLFCGLPQRIK